MLVGREIAWAGRKGRRAEVRVLEGVNGCDTAAPVKTKEVSEKGYRRGTLPGGTKRG